MTVGFFLQPLLQSSASPLAAFGFHFHLNLAQGARASGLGAHRVPWVVVAALAARATGFAPHYGGSVKMRPSLSMAGQPPGQPKFEVIATNPLGELSNSTPALSDGEIFVRSHGALYCIANSK